MQVPIIETEQDYDALLSSNSWTFVQFTASWCQPCVAMVRSSNKSPIHTQTRSPSAKWIPEGAVPIRWGIDWAGGNKPVPCPACEPFVKGIIEGAS